MLSFFRPGHTTPKRMHIECAFIPIFNEFKSMSIVVSTLAFQYAAHAIKKIKKRKKKILSFSAGGFANYRSEGDLCMRKKIELRKRQY